MHLCGEISLPIVAKNEGCLEIFSKILQLKKKNKITVVHRDATEWDMQKKMTPQ